MNGPIFYSAGHTDALNRAVTILREKGCIFAPQPDSSVTHLLLGVPSFEPDGSLKGGGSLPPLLDLLPQNVTIFGGNLASPLLSGRSTVDLLTDPLYLAENADITAHCAVKLALSHLSVTLKDCSVLVIGWGRIGKCLARLLRQMGARVTVAARKPEDRAMLFTLGYDADDSTALGYGLVRYRLIFNTVPATVLAKDTAMYCHPDCLKIDLASKLGIDAPDVIWARGLPSKYAPESSGALIARTILRLR